MTLTRRGAAFGALAAGAAVLAPGAASAVDIEPVLETPTEDDSPTQVDALGARFAHMIAPVTVNGQGPFRFLLDTGANVSVVSDRLAQKLDLEPGSPKRVHTMVAVRERPSFVIDHLQVGARSRKRVRAAALPIGDPNIDGVLGVDWLRGQRLVLDFKARSLEITRSRGDPPMQNRVVVPARRRLGQLTIVDADLSGQRINAMIDSGSEVSICNKPLRDLVRASELRRGAAPSERQIRLETMAGESFAGEPMYLPFMRLGGLHLGNVPVVYADMHIFRIWELHETPSIVLGLDVLTQFNAIALDFGRSAVRFDI